MNFSPVWVGPGFYEGCWGKIVSVNVKFYGQIWLASWTELEIFTISESNSVLKAANARGLGSCPQ